MAYKLTPTPATLQCAGVACEALLDVLSADPRVRRAFVAWLEWPDVAILERLVRDELKLPYDWLPELLMQKFAAGAWSYVTGASAAIRVTPTDLPLGRGAKGDGDYIRRDVEWLYHRKYRVPPTASVSQLAADYEREVGRRTDARSVVQTGINRAEQLLAIFEGFAI